MFECFLKCFPWDLLDEGIDAVLDRLQGEVGASGLTLVALSDEVEQFRPHLCAEPKIYRTSGGVYFQPNASYYEATRLKPMAWTQHAKVDVLSKVSEACAARQLDLRVALTPFDAQRLLGKHPEMACKNAYGVPSTTRLCPANPDVQEYLVAITRDLSQYDDVSAIVLDEVQWPPATDAIPYMTAYAMLGGEAAWLLGCCFCESSLQAAAKAGVDGQAALRAVRALLDRHCQQGRSPDAPHGDVVDEYPAIARYVEWADNCLVEMFGRLKKASSKSLIFSFEAARSALVDLHYIADLLEFSDRIVIDTDDLDQVIESLNRSDAFSELITPAAVGRMELLVSLEDGIIDDAPEVVRQISHAAEAGAGGITVCHYGAVMENQFEWIHQGLRNARRLSET